MEIQHLERLERADWLMIVTFVSSTFSYHDERTSSPTVKAGQVRQASQSRIKVTNSVSYTHGGLSSGSIWQTASIVVFFLLFFRGKLDRGRFSSPSVLSSCTQIHINTLISKIPRLFVNPLASWYLAKKAICFCTRLRNLSLSGRSRLPPESSRT